MKKYLKLPLSEYEKIQEALDLALANTRSCYETK